MGFDLLYSMLNWLNVTSWKTLIFRCCPRIMRPITFSSFWFAYCMVLMIVSACVISWGCVRKRFENSKVLWILVQIFSSFKYDMFFLWIRIATLFHPIPSKRQKYPDFIRISLTTFHPVNYPYRYFFYANLDCGMQIKIRISAESIFKYKVILIYCE